MAAEAGKILALLDNPSLAKFYSEIRLMGPAKLVRRLEAEGVSTNGDMAVLHARLLRLEARRNHPETNAPWYPEDDNVEEDVLKSIDKSVPEDAGVQNSKNLQQENAEQPSRSEATDEMKLAVISSCKCSQQKGTDQDIATLKDSFALRQSAVNLLLVFMGSKYPYRELPTELLTIRHDQIEMLLSTLNCFRMVTKCSDSLMFEILPYIFDDGSFKKWYCDYMKNWTVWNDFVKDFVKRYVSRYQYQAPIIKMYSDK